MVKGEPTPQALCSLQMTTSTLHLYQTCTYMAIQLYTYTQAKYHKSENFGVNIFVGIDNYEI